MCYILPDFSSARKRAATNMYGDVILHLAADGFSIQQIGYALFLAPPTVIMCLCEIVATGRPPEGKDWPASQTRAAKALVDALDAGVTK